MPKKKVRKGGLWNYLGSIDGLLEYGSDEMIEQAKRDYRKIYQRQYGRKRRTQNQQYTVWLSPKENAKVIQSAKAHHQSPSQFIRLAALSYLSQVFLVPDKKRVARLFQMLSLCHNDVKHIAKAQPTNFWSRNKDYNLLAERIEALETELVQLLRKPTDLEREIGEAIIHNPELRKRLLNLLQSHDSQVKNKEVTELPSTTTLHDEWQRPPIRWEQKQLCRDS